MPVKEVLDVFVVCAYSILGFFQRLLMVSVASLLSSQRGLLSDDWGLQWVMVGVLLLYLLFTPA
jgi:hypothetical protein